MENQFLAKRAAKAAEQAEAIAAAERAEAEKIANAVAKSATDRQDLHDRVRNALRIPAHDFDTLNKMVAENRVKVDAAVSVVESDASEANDEILKDGIEGDEKLNDYKEFLQDVNEAKRIAIKTATIEGLKAKRDESKTSLAQNRVSSRLNNQFDNLTDEEISAIDAAHGSGDVAALKDINKAVEERLNATKKDAESLKSLEISVRDRLMNNETNSVAETTPVDSVAEITHEESEPETAPMSTRERLKAEGVRLNTELQKQLADPEDGAKTERSIAETSEKMKELNIKIVALQESGAVLTPEMLKALTSELAQLENDQKLNYAKEKSRSIKKPIEWTMSPLTGNYLSYKSGDKSYPLFDGSRGTEADKKLGELTEFSGEVYNQARKIKTSEIQLPDSEHKALFSQSFDLNGLQQGLNNLNAKGQNYVKARKEMGASDEELKTDPEVIKLRKQIGVIKELMATKAESYKQEHARLQESAPKSEGEFLSRITRIEDGFSELNNSYRDGLREIRNQYQTYLEGLKKQHPEFDVRNNPEYAALYQSSSGKSDLKLEAISRKTNEDFARFALEEIQNDPKMVAFMKDAAKKVNQYGVASMELNQQKLDLRALFLPRKDWMKDTETAENMWKQLNRSNASDTLDTSFLDTNIAGKFGLVDLEGFEPVPVSSLPEKKDLESGPVSEQSESKMSAEWVKEMAKEVNGSLSEYIKKVDSFLERFKSDNIRDKNDKLMKSLRDMVSALDPMQKDNWRPRSQAQWENDMAQIKERLLQRVLSSGSLRLQIEQAAQNALDYDKNLLEIHEAANEYNAKFDDYLSAGGDIALLKKSRLGLINPDARPLTTSPQMDEPAIQNVIDYFTNQIEKK